MSKKEISLDQMPYTNRELSWLQFNERVLEEACKRENPPMERLNFLVISASNLDEFFMVRVGGLREQCRQGVKKKGPGGLTPQKQLKRIGEQAHLFVKKQYACLTHSILPPLRKAGIVLKKYAGCTPVERRVPDAYFDRVIYPLLTPLAVDPSRPFPLLANRSVSIAVQLSEENQNAFALIQLPAALPRLIRTSPNRCHFILLEDLIAAHLEKLFPGRRIRSSTVVRITRNSDLSIDEGAEDLMQEIKKSIKKRRRGRPVRLEIEQGGDEKTCEFLLKKLNLRKSDLYELPGMPDLTALREILSLPGYESLRVEPLIPAPAADFLGWSDPFAAIRERDRLVHHPYEQFDCVTDFLRRASEDPDVLAIKQTLYRVSGDSPVIHTLERAAENGKQVTVLVELKARFDEENNIRWARRLECAGCHVLYGVGGLKTHCKILMIVRREGDDVRRYLHLGTGNYNDATARLYTDIGLFTCRESYGADATLLFNALTGCAGRLNYRKFITAPEQLRPFFLQKIEREIENARSGLPSGITIKVNALVDAEIIRMLYTASQSGVPIQLIVRGICALVPGISGYSENIQVTSIVGQLLEHSRIYRFENGGAPQLYLGSADLMPRNLDRRVELVFPVEDPRAATRLEESLSLMLADNVNARIQLPSAEYALQTARSENRLNSQLRLAELARERAMAVDTHPAEPMRGEQITREESQHETNWNFDKRRGLPGAEPGAARPGQGAL